MPLFVLERVVPAAFDIADPAQRALHSRWAADAYLAAGVVWLGGVAMEGQMYSLVVADDEAMVRRYCAALGLADGDWRLRPVVGLLGPHVAMSRDDPRYRPPRHRPPPPG